MNLQTDLQLRHKKIQARLQADNIDACLISTNVNLLYTAGFIFSGYTYIPQKGKVLFFIRRPAGIESPDFVYIRKPEDIPGILQDKKMELPQSLLVEGGEVSYSEWTRYGKIFSSAKLYDGTVLLRQVRSVKTDYEVELIAESARKQSEAYRQFPSLYKPGMTDHEFTIEMEHLLRKNGNLGIFRIFGASMEAFMGSMLAGDNAGEPSAYDFALGGQGMHPSIPIGHNGTLLTEGMSIMVDFGGNYFGYVSDQSRVFSIGRLPEKAYFAHEVSLEIQQILAEMGKPGVKCEDLYVKSLEIAEKKGLSDCYMGKKQQAKFVGHGVGLVVNELPVLCMRSKEILEENMTIALEPKFIIDGVGAVGTENTFVVRKNGMEKLTSAPEEIILL